MAKKTAIQASAQSQQLIADVPVIVSKPEPVCETCHYWVRLNSNKTRTSFGNCIRWQDVLVDNRGGVQASPLTPLTPELASCHEWVDRTMG